MYRGYVLLKNRLLIRKALQLNPIILKSFSSTWIFKNVVPVFDQPIDSVHPLYVLIANPREQALFVAGLEILFQQRRMSIINELKQCQSANNMISLGRNIQTFALLYARNPSTIINPSNIATKKVPDIKFVRDKLNWVIEVFTVFGSDREEEEGKIIIELHARVNRYPDNPFVISAEILGLLKMNYLEYIWIELLKKIKQLRTQITDHEFVICNKNHDQLIKFEFSQPNKHSKGFWGTNRTGVRIRKDSARLKGKILDKLINIQFTSIEDINGYILYLEDWMMEPHDLEDALLGQQVIYFGDNVGKPLYGRKPNGVIHHEVGGKKLFDWVDFFIVAQHPSKLSDETHTKIYLNSDRKQVTEDQIRELLK